MSWKLSFSVGERRGDLHVSHWVASQRYRSDIRIANVSYDERQARLLRATEEGQTKKTRMKGIRFSSSDNRVFLGCRNGFVAEVVRLWCFVVLAVQSLTTSAIRFLAVSSCLQTRSCTRVPIRVIITLQTASLPITPVLDRVIRLSCGIQTSFVTM